MVASLILFEDNMELRKTLVNVINNSDRYIVVGDYDDVSDVVNITNEKMPDIVILDINMPGMSGIDAISLIKEAKPDVFIVMYTQFEDHDRLFESLCAGADGYILKKVSPFKLIDAIDEVCRGGAPMSPSIAKQVLNSFLVRKKPLGAHYNLTPKESAIIQLLMKGYSVKLIASESNISYDTTRTHLRNIYRKLHVNCGKEAIAKILSEKIDT
jgi:DNA-binding NarL/FixJ family response regulator